jgi:hypothetical protein
LKVRVLPQGKVMNLKTKLKTGQEILLQNDGDQTHIQLQSGDDSSRESQGTSFKTGKWAKAPSLFTTKEGAVLQVETDKEPVFFAIGKNSIDHLDTAPDLDGADKVELKETDEAPTSVDIKPMAPMKPMKPMEPLKPL